MSVRTSVACASGSSVGTVQMYSCSADSGLKCDPLLLNVLLPQQETIAKQYVTRLNDHIRRAASARGFHGSVLQRLQQIFRIVIACLAKFLAAQ